ncbi:hypothetical protein BC940DRAFT_244014, partial [Gongronella butleri]
MAPKRLISLHHQCHICGIPLSRPDKVKEHVWKNHKVYLPSRSKGLKRFETEEFTYVKADSGAVHELIERHIPCISCLAHYPTIDELAAHINSTHL